MTWRRSASSAGPARSNRYDGMVALQRPLVRPRPGNGTSWSNAARNSFLSREISTQRRTAVASLSKPNTKVPKTVSRCLQECVRLLASLPLASQHSRRIDGLAGIEQRPCQPAGAPRLEGGTADEDAH